MRVEGLCFKKARNGTGRYEGCVGSDGESGLQDKSIRKDETQCNANRYTQGEIPETPTQRKRGIVVIKQDDAKVCTHVGCKAERDGKAFVKIDRWFPSSKVCSECGYQMGKMTLDVRSWTCPSCNTHHDRDINAAKNIRDEGLRILASGIGATAGGGNIRRKLGRKSSTNADAVETGSPRL